MAIDRQQAVPKVNFFLGITPWDTQLAGFFIDRLFIFEMTWFIEQNDAVRLASTAFESRLVSF